MKTRQDYLNGKCTHREYYSQFVTKHIIKAVSDSIGKDKILASKNEYFNDINLTSWDMLTNRFAWLWREMMKRSDDSYSLASGVCILKEAAKQIKEQNSVIV